mgnify:CR=1 FL=1
MNPFQPLYDACNSGDPQEKHDGLPAFPRIIDIELTNACNFRCLMCPTGNLSMKRPSGFMDAGLYHKILEQCVDHKTALRFIGWGEPTLHPGLRYFVLTASADAGLLTHLNTNGAKIDLGYAAELVDAELSSIKFSFQGVDRATYEEMRRTDFYQGMIKAIWMVRATRGSRALPFIAASTTITHETPEMVAAFRAEVGPLVDHLSIGHTVFDFMDLKAVRLRPNEKAMLERLAGLASGDKKHPVPCPEVYDKLTIHWDGSVSVCCNDFDGLTNLGNVNDVPLSAIWRHPVMESYRRRLADKEYTGPLCSVCYDYQGLSQGAKKDAPALVA